MAVARAAQLQGNEAHGDVQAGEGSMIATYAGCPHCHSIASMFPGQDRFGKYVSCLMCGFYQENDIPLEVVEDLAVEFTAGDHRRGMVGGRRQPSPTYRGAAL